MTIFAYGCSYPLPDGSIAVASWPWWERAWGCVWVIGAVALFATLAFRVVIHRRGTPLLESRQRDVRVLCCLAANTSDVLATGGRDVSLHVCSHERNGSVMSADRYPRPRHRIIGGVGSATLIVVALLGCAASPDSPVSEAASESAPSASSPTSEAAPEAAPVAMPQTCGELPYASQIESLLGTGDSIELEDVSAPSERWPNKLDLTCGAMYDDGLVAVRAVAVDYRHDGDPCDLTDILKYATPDGDGAYNADINEGWVYYVCASDGALIRARYYSSVEAVGPSLEQIRDLARQAAADPESLVAIGRAAQ